MCIACLPLHSIHLICARILRDLLFCNVLKIKLDCHAYVPCKNSCSMCKYLARHLQVSCTLCARILHWIVYKSCTDLAYHVHISCSRQCTFLARVRILLHFSCKTCKITLARLARKWPNYVQDSKISARHARSLARNSIFLQEAS